MNIHAEKIKRLIFILTTASLIITALALMLSFAIRIMVFKYDYPRRHLEFIVRTGEVIEKPQLRIVRFNDNTDVLNTCLALSYPARIIESWYTYKHSDSLNRAGVISEMYAISSERGLDVKEIKKVIKHFDGNTGDLSTYFVMKNGEEIEVGVLENPLK